MLRLDALRLSEERHGYSLYDDGSQWSWQCDPVEISWTTAIRLHEVTPNIQRTAASLHHTPIALQAGAGPNLLVQRPIISVRQKEKRRLISQTHLLKAHASVGLCVHQPAQVGDG